VKGTRQNSFPAGILIGRPSGDPMTEKPDGKQWKTRDKWVALAVALFAAYMGMYYETVRIDLNGGIQRRQSFELSYWELPPWFDGFFAPADWIDDRIRLSPCRNPPARRLR
jgi:hypothetical protein